MKSDRDTQKNIEEINRDTQKNRKEIDDVQLSEDIEVEDIVEDIEEDIEVEETVEDTEVQDFEDLDAITARNQSGQGGAGMLYLCATPIGNLEDITFRVLRTLKEVDMIAAEDTRNTIKLLNHFEIKTPMTSYHEYNKYDKARVLVDKMRQGMNIAVVTDAGTPGISDPGEELVKQSHAAGIKVTSLPGPAACITALTMSGQATRRFSFEAFLPSDKQERKEVLEELSRETRTMIVYEAPHHLLKTLKELSVVLGGERNLSICKELTKRYENAFLTTFEEAITFYESNSPRGEYVLVIEGRDRKEIIKEKQQQWETMSVADHVAMYLDQGMDKKEAMKAAAKDRGVSKRDIYQQLLGND